MQREPDMARPAGSATTAQSRDAILLDTIARHLADEMSYLMQLSDRVQEALSGCAFAAPPDPGTLAGLQYIDRIGQGLADVNRLLRLLPSGFPDNAALPRDMVLAHLTLRDLVTRIAPTDGQATTTPGDHYGDVVWL